MQANKPLLIVGLGNPGTKYKTTRHNVGFMAVDFMAGGAMAKWGSEKNAITNHMDINGQKVILVKPQTFMNNSGVPVLNLMNFYKIPIDNLIVIHDDVDVKIGKIREKIGGTSAGHNGIKSIDANIGSEYRRIRIGVGHPRDFDLPIDTADWVLGNFSKNDLIEINKLIENINIS